MLTFLLSVIAVYTLTLGIIFIILRLKLVTYNTKNILYFVCGLYFVCLVLFVIALVKDFMFVA